MTPASQQIAEAGRILADEGVPDAGRDAQKLMALALEVDPSQMVLHLGEELTPEQYERFWILVSKRQSRVPISHLLGFRDFYKNRFKVGPQVLDPRPETEKLVEVALEQSFTTLLDLGTGSGAILLSLLDERPNTTGIGTDVSEAALELAQDNAQTLKLADRARFVQSDWFEHVEGVFDLIVSNPPYIAADELAALAPELAHEPCGALTDEGDGLSAHRAITAKAPQFLQPGGALIVEIGPTQGEAVARLFAEAGFEGVGLRKDLDGRDRVVMGKKPRKTA